MRRIDVCDIAKVLYSFWDRDLTSQCGHRVRLRPRSTTSLRFGMPCPATGALSDFLWSCRVERKYPIAKQCRSRPWRQISPTFRGLELAVSRF